MKFQAHNLNDTFVIVVDRNMAQELVAVCVPDENSAVRALGERLKGLLRLSSVRMDEGSRIQQKS